MGGLRSVQGKEECGLRETLRTADLWAIETFIYLLYIYRLYYTSSWRQLDVQIYYILSKRTADISNAVDFIDWSKLGYARPERDSRLLPKGKGLSVKPA